MTWEYEEKAWANGYGSVCGVDEAGRGPVAGPVCAAAVILPAGIVIEGLNDSKKLSEKKREKLFDEITANALAWSVSLVDERVIDEINILQATYRAMKQAVDGLTRPADFVYVDGNRSQGLEQPHECVVSGDAKIPSVAAASIIAKVTRDRLMRRFAEQYRSTALKSTRATRLRRTMRHCSNTVMPDPPDDLPQEILQHPRDEGRVGRKSGSAVPRKARLAHGRDEFPHPVR
ncbi:MAG: ribonuclease HII [Butyricicoccus sp.]